jgi:hypothetical protein
MLEGVETEGRQNSRVVASKDAEDPAFVTHAILRAGAEIVVGISG